MRLTKEAATKNRAEIVDTATRLFKARGIDGVSISDLMKEAGFTHGGFYNHFASKDLLAAAAVRHAFEQSLAGIEGSGSEDEIARALEAALSTYLAPEHRDDLAGACPTGAMPVDVARQAAGAQSAYADGLERYVALVERLHTGDRAKAIALLSRLVGGIILARAVRFGRPDLSDEILQAAHAGDCD